MPTYAIGDLQGCYDALQALLSAIDFNPSQDKLWFTGDLVNRGPDSLATLRFVRDLGSSARTVLGNHDLHFLAVAHGAVPRKASDTLDELLAAKDCESLCDWLCQQPLLHHDPKLKFTLVHAGVYPVWDLQQAQARADELSICLKSEHASDFFLNMYGNLPTSWSEALQGWDRLRFIANAFTRMRFCQANHALVLDHKGSIQDAPTGLIPWYEMSNIFTETNVAFGHWAALQIPQPRAGLYALDSGCVWGNQLSALCLESLTWTHVEGKAYQAVGLE